MILVMFISNVKALGTLQKKNYLEIEPGQIAEFDILFWDSESTEIELEERVIPKNWIVIVEPKKFVLGDNVTSSEVIRIRNEYIKALPIKIFAIPPEDINPGIYEITLNMVAGENDRGISFFQEKNFNFRVNILGQPPEENRIVIGSINESVSETKNFTVPITKTEKLPPNFTRIIFWLITVILVLLVSWVVYKL
jgi:hypothetical protein